MTEVTPSEGADRREAAGARQERVVRREGSETGREQVVRREGSETGREQVVRREGLETRREAGRTERPGRRSGPGGRGEAAVAPRPGVRTAGEPGTRGDRREAPLLSPDASDELGMRLQHAVGGFVDNPREAVEEADHVVEEAAARLAEALASRRRTLKASWQDTGDGPHATADTEQLRLALRDYRATAERLLRM
ncbi:hypothetical protein PV336_00810 [Streptomyces sp. MI02-2A]|uniref:hypothetical protein n=1 Tax=unclassified Streptomyces TaxID=2593676 RepID=UPI0007413CA5|nr:MULTISPECIES: hypothetical protein [unclassified Streptomyces]KUJ58489.1 hypothetical protein ADL25_02385 [Streptomyces sp. NRRL F-5122]MDX3257784.1 hypothetical protein [Streptomyces sp. MI02-2A]